MIEYINDMFLLATLRYDFTVIFHVTHTVTHILGIPHGIA